MNKLEKAIIAGTLVIGGSLLRFGLYRDKKFPEDYKINWAIKGAGLISLTVVSGLGLRELVEGDDKKYFEEKNNNLPRQNYSQKGL